MINEAVDLLQRYIRLNTSNPPGNEYLAVDFFTSIFKEAGIECKTYEPKPGRISIRAEIQGAGLQGPLILLHHIDVIAADKKDWSFDPFSGDIINGHICGRGALDTKSLGIMQLLAFLAIKKNGLKPSRNLVFLATADEESGADCGVDHLLRDYPHEFNADLVLNEGSYVVSGLLPNKLIAMISPGEKGPCWLRLKRKGLPGHGSTPHGHNPLEQLTKAVNRLLSYEPPVVITPIAGEYFKRLATDWDFLKPYAVDGKPETLIKIIRDNDLLSMPQINAMVRNTISLNSLQSGARVNVIPSYAEAEVDIRLLPGQNMEEFMVLVKKHLSDDLIRIEPISQYEGNASDMNTESYRLIEMVLQEHYPDAITAPYLMLGTSDSRFFRDRGVTAYGFCPAVIPAEDLKSIHGNDERISIESMVTGTEIYKDIVRRLCI
ncbi:MAG: M20/M25/M40 family metallo-hydrolase [Dehalococcoidia bacterium]|nr:M20/M25/M40 family metallo-hydrolase [Dehalococcoidia bacterium]MDD5495040.1 M20/M25/M40 family metallo-hydrolase [Dehalococcoidia bacterium]